MIGETVVQVDKQGQMLSRELMALHKKMEGETTRRSFVTRYISEEGEEGEGNLMAFISQWLFRCSLWNA